MADLLLRTFQRLERVDQLRRQGRLVADWAHVLPGTRHAYERMVEAMAERGIDTKGRPPMWAWRGTLRLMDAASLFDPAHELSAGFAVITFTAPTERVLLCDYGHWCDLLMAPTSSDFDEWQPRPPPPSANSPGQACLPHLKGEWVTDIKPLPVSRWDEIDLDVVL